MSDTEVPVYDLEAGVAAVAALHKQLWHDIGPRLTCSEADALIYLLRALGLTDEAECLLEGHQADDDENEGDIHVAPSEGTEP